MTTQSRVAELTAASRSQLSPAEGSIDFAIGQPEPDLLPFDEVWSGARALWNQGDRSVLNYGHPKGDGLFRNALSAFLGGEYGCRVDPESLLTTNGASQALDLIASRFAEPGETVILDQPTYFLAQQIFADRGLKLRSVPFRPEGWDLQALEEAFDREKPRLYYTVPTYHNPSGQTMSLEFRERLVELADRYGVLVVADEVYQLLGYGAPPPPPLATWVSSGAVVSVGSFSKILAPGLRLGWIQTSPENQGRLLESGLLRSGGGLNPYISTLVGELLLSGVQEAVLQRLRRLYGHRIEVMDRALVREFGDRIRYQRPEGGYFFWLELLPTADGRSVPLDRFLEAARELKTGFQPGPRFSVAGGLEAFVRLSFARYPENALDVGVTRLAKAWERATA